MEAKAKSRSVGTHDGAFHADEVTACALLVVFDLVDEDKIVRTRDPLKLHECEFVCDVGGEYDPNRKLFDHHQADYVGRLSSAGMILRYLKEQGILNENEFNFFSHTLINGVDDHDNGLDPQIPGICTYSHIMANFTPIQYDVNPKEQDEAFFEALTFAKGHLIRLWHRYQYIQSCRETVAEVMESQDVGMIFEKAIPWMDTFFELGGEKHPAQFIIMPTGKHWKLRGIPPSLDHRMEVRFPLPKEWAGLLDEDLKRITGMPGAIFCHKGRFISVWETKEDALKALAYVLNTTKEKR